MLLQELLGINEEIYFIEESYTSQRTPQCTLQYLNTFRNFPDTGNTRIIRVREAGHTLGLLFFNPADEDVPVRACLTRFELSDINISKTEFEIKSWELIDIKVRYK